jgi:O-antigen ligase
MEKTFRIQDAVSNKISMIHLLLFAASMPFDRFYSELILISFTIHTLLHLKRSHLKNLRNNKIALVSVLYLAKLISTIYTHDSSEAFSEWVKQLALLLIPLLFFLNPLLIRRYRFTILSIFSLSCLATIAYLFFDAFRTIHFYHLPLRALFTPAFMNHNFSAPIELHATYLAMYSVMAFVFFFNRAVQTRTLPTKVGCIAALGLLAAGLVQLAARTPFFCLLFIMLAVIPFYYFKKRARVVALAFGVLISLGFILFIYQADPLEERYVAGLKEDISFTSSQAHISDPRAERWALAFTLFTRKPLLGYGAGSETRILREAYFEHKLYDSYIHQLNAHNQYLSYLLTGGILSAFLYLLSLGLGIRYAIVKRDIHFICFMLLLTAVSFSENILDVNKGIFFFSFYYSLFISFHFPYASQAKQVKQPERPGSRLYKIMPLH